MKRDEISEPSPSKKRRALKDSRVRRGVHCDRDRGVRGDRGDRGDPEGIEKVNEAEREDE